MSPDITTGPLLEMEIRRVPLGFQIDQPWTEDAKRLQVRWLEGRGRFEGAWEADGDRHKITLQPLADGETLRVVVANRLNQSAKEASKDSGPEDKSIGNLSTQDWTRISKSLSTTFPEKRYGMPVTLTPSEPDTRLSRTDPREVRALPNTPAAKQLAEQLGAQESAAAAEAATIRQLQANGQAEQNRQAIAEHQRKLKNLLSTAFDLKLQWEELQVKELQSRLSRLERQIGQRKELREKIINRRAGELIEGDALRWDSTAPASTKLPGSAVGNIKKSAKTATPAAVAILRERLGLLWDDLRSGKAKPEAVLRAMNELAQAEPPEAHAQHVELLQGLLELVRRLQSNDSVSKAEVLEIEAAYEKAKSLSDGSTSKTSPTKPPTYVDVKPEADDIVVDLYGGSQVLPGLGKNPGYSKLFQSLNALKGVTTNFREAGKGAVIVMAIVRDPAQRCQREARQTQKESELRITINSALKAAGIEAARWDENADSEEKSADEPAASKPDQLPTPEELKTKLKPFADPVKAAMKRVRDLEPTFFKDRSNLKEMQQAMQELAQTRAASKPIMKEVKVIRKDLDTEYQLTWLAAQGLESRVGVLTEKLGRGEATEAEVRAAIAEARKAPRSKASLEARMAKYQAVWDDIGEMVIREDDALPPFNAKRTGPQPSYHPAFAKAWIETALQTKVEFVSLAGLDLPFKSALRIIEAHDNLEAGDLIVTLIGASFDTLDQAVTSSNVVTKRTSSDLAASIVLKGGLSGPRVNEHLDLGSDKDCLNPSAPTDEWWDRFDFKVHRGGKVESETIEGTCVGPDGLVVIPIASSLLDPDTPIASYRLHSGTVQIVGRDDHHGLTLLKLSGPLRQWVKCRALSPKLEQKLSYIQDDSRSACVVTSIGLAYPKPLAGDDAFHIKHIQEFDLIKCGDKLVTEENELQGLVLETIKDPNDKNTSDRRALVVSAVHIQKLIDEYRDKSSSQKPDGQSLSQPPKGAAPSSSPPNSSDERTFDGTPYSQWLKMLETERKPDKLATAMEACARLATGDERRIARGLFVAAKLFEATDNTKERNLVWDAGTAALKRLPGEAVVAELLAALHDEQFQEGREFPCRFLISVATTSKSSVSDSLTAAFKRHDQELVTTLLKRTPPVPEASANGSPMDDRRRRLLAGAVSVWLISERKLGEFEGLSPLVMAAIDEVYSLTTGSIDRYEQPWSSASSRLVKTEPETPGLAILFAKHINKDRTPILGRLSDMGAHAEPAVPLLIEDFLVHWKSRENKLRGSVASDKESAAERFLNVNGDVPLSEEGRMVQVLNVLGAIGPKTKSAVPLLRQIAVLAPSKRADPPPSLNDRLFDAVKKTLALIGDPPAAEPGEAPILLSDFSRLLGAWNLSSLTPKADHKDIQFEFDWQLSIEDKHVRGNFEVVRKVMNHIGANANVMHYRINDTVTPRQIELIDKEQRHRQFGIYELKGHRLKIELAKPGLPRPKEFSADPNKLPEGHVLLELDRDRAE